MKLRCDSLLSAITQPAIPHYVHEAHGVPVVRRRRVAYEAAIGGGACLAGGLIVRMLLDYEPIVLAGVAVMPCSLAAGTVLRIDRERHFVRYGEWRFMRFALGTLLAVSAIAAVFFAVLSYALREQRRLLAADQVLKTDLQDIVQGGRIFIDGKRRRGIGCIAMRASFSDADLARLIDRFARRHATMPIDLS